MEPNLAMSVVSRIAFLAIAAVLSGCGGNHHTNPKSPPAAPTPLSVADWRTLPASEKYDESTFQRLKLHDPKLKDERNWARFMKETVIAERRRDLPGDFANIP